MGKERKDKEFSAGEQEIQAVFARLCPLVTDALSLEKCELKLSDRPADLGADSLDMLIVAGKAEKAIKREEVVRVYKLMEAAARSAAENIVIKEKI